MEFHHFVAISVLICMAFVVDTTVKLLRYRRRHKDELDGKPFRDLRILRRPNDFPLQEARLTYKNWISCVAMLVTIAIFLFSDPERRHSSGAAAPAATGEPPAATAPGPALAR